MHSCCQPERLDTRTQFGLFPLLDIVGFFAGRPALPFAAARNGMNQVFDAVARGDWIITTAVTWTNHHVADNQGTYAMVRHT